jgi:hypothetical protein
MKTKIFHSPAKYDHLHSRWSPSSPSLLKEAEDSFLKPLNLQSEGEVKEQCHETLNFVIACLNSHTLKRNRGHFS